MAGSRAWPRPVNAYRWIRPVVMRYYIGKTVDGCELVLESLSHTTIMLCWWSFQT
jgi:hypothetical protein